MQLGGGLDLLATICSSRSRIAAAGASALLVLFYRLLKRKGTLIVSDVIDQFLGVRRAGPEGRQKNRRVEITFTTAK
jgi:hypothetical protein